MWAWGAVWRWIAGGLAHMCGLCTCVRVWMRDIAHTHKRMVRSPFGGLLHMFKMGLGLIWRADIRRLMVPIELVASMGFQV